MESRDLYQDDLTEEREITPAQRDDVARTQVLDPDVLDNGAASGLDGADDDEEDDDDEDDDDEDEDEDLDE